MPALKDIPKFPMKSTKADVIHASVRVVATTSGAVDTTNTEYPSPSGYSVVKKGATTGVYDVTFPPCYKVLYIGATVRYQTGDVDSISGSADVDASAGTWQFTCYDGGTAEDLTSGDKVDLLIIAQQSVLP